MVNRTPKSSSFDTAQTSNIPVVKEALNATLSTIARRAKLYRNLIISVAMLSVLSILISVIIRSWLPLCGIVLVVPLTGGFLLLDSRQVRRWQANMMEMWRFRHLNLKEFEKMISGFRHVPAQSLDGMLSTLPKDSSQFKRDDASEEEKAISAERIDAFSRWQQWRTLMGTVALMLMFSCLMAAALFRSAAFLFCFAGLAISLAILRKV